MATHRSLCTESDGCVRPVRSTYTRAPPTFSAKGRFQGNEETSRLPALSCCNVQCQTSFSLQQSAAKAYIAVTAHPVADNQRVCARRGSVLCDISLREGVLRRAQSLPRGLGPRGLAGKCLYLWLVCLYIAVAFS